MAAETAILVCTVGGSHQPILTALQAADWSRVVFVCTAETERSRGSIAMVEREIVVTRSTQVPVETLPPLPVLAGLDRDCWEVLEVPADDPDAIFAALLPRLRALARDHAGARIVGDFTGGTKSMSAGLTLAAIEAGLALQLVTGERDDLVRVRDLTQVPVALEMRRIAVERTRRILAEGWGRFAYQETAEGFSQLRSELTEEGWGRSELSPLTRAWELSKAFAAWDRFDHKPAASDLRKYRAVVIGGHTDWHSLALTLAERPQDRWTALALADLWANAQRCAARGRYDDAIGRWYRLCEGIAQWLLWADFKIVTASVPLERLPNDIRAGVEIDNGAAKLGLRRAWELYMRLRPEDELAAFVQKSTGDRKNEFDRLNDNLQRRNQSLLAHGFRPVSAYDWNKVSRWAEGGLLDVLAREAERVGEPHELPQLPTALPAL
jgi:CRISPR-associated protein (TIGR02710 family)